MSDLRGFAEKLIDALDSRKQVKARYAIGGGPDNFASYKECVGHIKGIDESIGIVREVYDEFIRGDED